MKIRFKRLVSEAKIPVQGSKGAAGFDLTATSREIIDNFHTKYGTGIAVEIPAGFVGLVFPRSSCYKRGMLLFNCVGVIDSDYRGEISFVFIGTNLCKAYEVGERVGQLVIVQIPEIEYVEAQELSETARGTGGYGSTGK